MLIMKIVSICGNHPRNLALAKKLSELDCLNQLFVEKREEFNPIPDSRWDKVDRDNFIKHFSNRKESEKILFEENYKLPNNTIFLKTIKENPHNWFARAAFVEHYVIPMVDEDEYETQKEFLEEAQETFEKEMKWNPFKKKPDAAFEKKNLRVYQALGLKRFEIITKYEKEIF